MAKVHCQPEGIPMKKIIALSLVAAALAVSACNTVAGAGRDVSAVGSVVTEGAEDAKN
jgi:predicted small secreted protein